MWTIGFRKECTIDNAVFTLTNNIVNCSKCKQTDSRHSLQLAKVFDHVNHDFLLDKLAFNCTCNTTILWFKTYLEKQKTKSWNTAQ